MTNAEFKLLLIDTDTELMFTIEATLKEAGFAVIASSNSKEAIQLAIAEQPHLILVDLAMPELDGIEICMKLKQEKKLQDTLIVFLTKTDEDYSQIAAFNAGADDYIIKPVKIRVLLSRLKALLKRHVMAKRHHNKKNVKGLLIDREKYVVFKAGKKIMLPRKEFELLSLLFTAPQKVFTRKEISELIWGYEICSGNRTIDVHIRKLREKLGNKYIKTIKGVGYRLEV